MGVSQAGSLASLSRGAVIALDALGPLGRPQPIEGARLKAWRLVPIQHGAYRRREQAQLDFLIVFCGMHALTREQRKRAREATSLISASATELATETRSAETQSEAVA